VKARVRSRFFFIYKDPVARFYEFCGSGFCASVGIVPLPSSAHLESCWDGAMRERSERGERSEPVNLKSEDLL
jgi:hypothetical protein